MTTKALTSETFDETLSADGLVLIDFWASWCGPCLRFAPIFERASEKHSDAVFAKVDTEAEPELSAQFGISSIPTLMIARDGILLYAEPGALPEKALEELITKAKELDMDAVRAQVAEEQAAS